MRDPARIPGVLERLGKLWEKHPQLRLGQLIINSSRWQSALYVLEDDALLELLEDYYRDVIS